MDKIKSLPFPPEHPVSVSIISHWRSKVVCECYLMATLKIVSVVLDHNERYFTTERYALI